ncbi:MAG: hypothetical protein HYX86_04105 [Chloroflexi bacterium]|nr:hypothetical protein [Chloroflexota bacterium]
MVALIILMVVAGSAFGFFLAYEHTNSYALAIVAALAAMPLVMLLVVFTAALILPRIGAGG